MTPAMSRQKRQHPRLALLALAAAAVTALPAGAAARTAHPHRCTPVKHSAGHRHGAGAHGCSHRTKPAKAAPHHSSAHRPATKPAPAVKVELVPAACEDGGVPARAGDGSYTCEDGSTPGCEEGTLGRRAGSGEPVCSIAAEGEWEACAHESAGECVTIEWACSDGPESAAGSDGCETEPPSVKREEEV